MTGPEQKSANALAQEVGIAQPTLSNWLRKAGSNMNSKTDVPKLLPSRVSDETATKTAARRPQEIRPLERARLVVMAENLKGEDRGVFLREHGIHEVHLTAWQETLCAALDDRGRRGTDSARLKPQNARIRELEREVLRKDRALAEATALVVLKKKAEILFGEEGVNDTRRRNGQ